MQTKIQLYQYIGWALIGSAVFLLICYCAEVVQGSSGSAVSIIPVALLLFGFLCIPGIIVLKKRWAALSSIISGFICLVLYVLLAARIDKLAALVATGKSPILDVIGALVGLLPFILPIWLHKLLQPKLQSVLEAKK